MPERNPRIGKSRTFKEQQGFFLPEGSGPCEVLVKSSSPHGTRLLVTFDDGSEPLFVWCPARGRHRVDKRPIEESNSLRG